MAGTTRRRFLGTILASGTVLAGCSGEGGDGDHGGPDAAVEPPEPPEPVPESANFPHGIASGDITASSAVLWCLHRGDGRLEVTVWEMDGDSYVRELATLPAERAQAGFVHVAVSGLTPGRRYRYAFFETTTDQRARSPIGRFRAAIADDAMEPLVFGALSCTDNSKAFDTLARAAGRDDLDLFLLVGDNSYCDGAEVLDDYRQLWSLHWGKPESIALRARTGMAITWDDHEVANDWNPELIDDQKLADARQAFFEHLPLARHAGAPDRIWRRARWGRTAELFVLDTRSERRPSTIILGDQQYISPEQMAWLKQGLVETDAVFKLIVNSVPITRMPPLWDAYPVDRWAAYPDQRREILDHIDDHGITGVVWIAGDFHLAFTAQVSPSGPGAGQLELLVGPGAQSGNPLVWTLQPPQFHWASNENNYTELRLSPATGELAVRYIGSDGGVIHAATFSP